MERSCVSVREVRVVHVLRYRIRVSHVARALAKELGSTWLTKLLKKKTPCGVEMQLSVASMCEPRLLSPAPPKPNQRSQTCIPETADLKELIVNLVSLFFFSLS